MTKSDLHVTEEIRPHLQYEDLRDWMREAEKLGELKVVEGLS